MRIVVEVTQTVSVGQKPATNVNMATAAMSALWLGEQVRENGVKIYSFPR